MTATKHIILFDGACNFCNFWVRYVIKRDQKDVFRFTSLQSEIGKELLGKHEVNPGIDSVVLIEDENVYLKSTAAFRILKTLGGISSICYAFIVLPKVGRDFFYDLIAGVRYKVFGKEICELPTKSDIAERFL